jgi:hypothetical protein
MGEEFCDELDLSVDEISVSERTLGVLVTLVGILRIPLVSWTGRLNVS